MAPLDMVPLDMVPLVPLDMVPLDMTWSLDMAPLDMVPLDMVPLVPLDMVPLDMVPLDFFDSSSNLLEESLKDSWTKTSDQENISLAERYLSSVEKLIVATNVTQLKKKRNIEVMATNCTKQNTECYHKVFNVSVILKSSDPGNVKTAGFKELEKYLPQKDKTLEPNSIVVSTTTEKKTSSVEVEIRFSLLRRRPPHVLMKCVAWDNAIQDWSEDGCKWSGASDEGLCTCKHLSSFAILMQRYPLNIAGLHEVTQVGLSVSVVSLVICLIIELRGENKHVVPPPHAHINISLCLLVADSCFLASMDHKSVSELWCRIFVVLKHFCFLSMFFWMLFLSGMLLHQAIFQFHHVSKTTYLRLSMFLGYVCPLLIVVITFLVYDGGIEGEYFSKESCWLLYEGLMKGSIHTFVIPVGIIVFVNVLSMMVVIMKLLDHPKNAERANESEKKAAVAVMRSVILLTPIFGVTWVFGFAVMLMDLTELPVHAAQRLPGFVHSVNNLRDGQIDPRSTWETSEEKCFSPDLQQHHQASLRISLPGPAVRSGSSAASGQGGVRPPRRCGQPSIRALSSERDTPRDQSGASQPPRDLRGGATNLLDLEQISCSCSLVELRHLHR
ncbi:hypothetical protein F7725_008720 [Dissostichus mawsoni]|uniref:Uncharacterized protein n=1 Tax=Dissostichus mawsoni TaxID=36200 RepID=A0A7J5YAG5_DISMA|nr:hypothetical protein F7725_008720 [Dissostichus mawsoni]